ncbi:MAG: hypothetical protein K2W85_09860 [Phycisphaerales bacterium]|nr:hypothetical protein [Phycisphaerales bacterium]
MPVLPVEAIAALIAVGIVSALFAAVFVGRWLGARRQRVEEADDPHIGVVQGAILALLGLLLGFSFSGASERFVQRQDIIVRETSAIGTAYMRCDLFAPIHSAAIRQVLQEYVDARIDLFEASGREALATSEAKRRIDDLQDRLWRAAADAARETPQFAALIVTPVTEVIDAYELRTAATRRHIPMLVMAIMIACAMASLGSVGYVMGLSKRSLRGPVVLLIVLITAALWVTIDLDFARHGLIQIDARPLLELRESMKN